MPGGRPAVIVTTGSTPRACQWNSSVGSGASGSSGTLSQTGFSQIGDSQTGFSHTGVWQTGFSHAGVSHTGDWQVTTSQSLGVWQLTQLPSGGRLLQGEQSTHSLQRPGGSLLQIGQPPHFWHFHTMVDG